MSERRFLQRFLKLSMTDRTTLETTRARTKGLKCHECEGFGHYQRECPNFLRKQKKGYSATLSDEEDGDSETEEVSNFVAFTAFTSQTNIRESAAVANTPLLHQSMMIGQTSNLTRLTVFSTRNGLKNPSILDKTRRTNYGVDK